MSWTSDPARPAAAVPPAVAAAPAAPPAPVPVPVPVPVPIAVPASPALAAFTALAARARREVLSLDVRLATLGRLLRRLRQVRHLGGVLLADLNFRLGEVRLQRVLDALRPPAPAPRASRPLARLPLAPALGLRLGLAGRGRLLARGRGRPR